MNRGEEIAAARLRRRVLYALIAFWALVAQMVFPPAPRLVWNASASAPVGLWRVRPGARIRRGDMVIARTPTPVRRLAAERRYLPENVPLVKRVAGVAGDRICAAGATITINERVAARRLPADRLGRPMPHWEGCRLLGSREYFLLMADVPASFDGRYFGITLEAGIIGRAQPLWVR